ncbi:hypothetical protein HPB49_022527 [Dermacentor silvarum]|uniref:Uncharacterized protein n=1 Tax=Dermacentor silvarum TaxID=543639 RepID=A0ACB8DGB5_DERSI|nr:hypothetical protein HPB49_022527 [Dermacentor silvarum]
MVDSTSSPQSGRTVVFPMLSSLATLRHPRYRRMLTACVLLIVVTFVVGTVALSLFLTSSGSKLRGSAVSTEQSFCCPLDARETASAINASISPCRDFFGRICNSVIEFKLWKRATELAEIERVMITGVFPKGTTRGEAGRFLTAYYKSCVETLPHQEAFVSGLATALTRATRELLSKANSRNAFLYATMASLKYQLPSAFAMYYNPNGSYLTLGVNMLCQAGTISPDVVTASTNALDSVAGILVTQEEVYKLTGNICSHVAAVGIQGIKKQYRVDSGDADEFNRTVWNVKDLRFALRAVGYLVNNKTNILVNGSEEVRAVYELYASEDVELIGAKAAFLLLHSVENGMWQFYGSHDGSWPGVFRICSSSVQVIDSLWAKFVMELKTDPEKLDRIRAVFEAVKDAVHRDVSSSPIFEAEDAQNVTHFFNTISLITPWTDAGLRLVSVPEPTLVFAVDLLRARVYNFNVYRARRHVPLGDYVNRHHIFLPAIVCDFVRAGSGPSSEIPNMAILGLLVAENIWSMALSYKKWSRNTHDSMKRLYHCYVEDYFGPVKNNGWALLSMTTALALSSVLKAFDRSGWYTVRPAWSLLRMSHGEIFYTLLTYYRCPLELTPEMTGPVNSPFVFVQDFAKVFRCGSDSPMAKPQRCINRTDSWA